MGPAPLAQSLRAVCVGGEVASVGFLSPEGPGVDFFALKLSGASFRNTAVGDRSSLVEFCRAVSGTRLKPVIDRVFAFGEAREAFARLELAGHVG